MKPERETEFDKLLRAWSDAGTYIEREPVMEQFGSLIAAIEADAVAEAQKNTDRYRLALESLTPGGSEYVRDPERCVAAVRERYASEHDAWAREGKRRKEAETRIAALTERVRELEKEASEIHSSYTPNFPDAT